MGIATSQQVRGEIVTPPNATPAVIVTEGLSRLETAPEGVGMALVGAGSYGLVRNPEACPIARYLTVMAGSPVLIGVDHAFVGPDPDTVDRLDLGPRVKCFVTDFDAGRYPILESETVHASSQRMVGVMYEDRNGDGWVVTNVAAGMARIDRISHRGAFQVVGIEHLSWMMRRVGRSRFIAGIAS